MIELTGRVSSKKLGSFGPPNFTRKLTILPAGYSGGRSCKEIAREDVLTLYF